jgi:AraC-like DNA-binding protein
MLEETRPDGNGRARGIVSSRASGSRVESRTFAPSEALRPFVATLWIARWDLRDQTPHEVEILSDPCVNVVVEQGASRVVGVSTRVFRRTLTGAGVIRAAKLRAGAALALLPDRPAADWTDRVAPLREAWPDTAADIEREVLAPEDDVEALERLDTSLRTCLREVTDDRVALATAIVARIADDPEILTAQRVAEVSGLSLRPLQRLFREAVGIPPKWVVRRYRLQEAALRLERDDAPSLASLAADLGYADHAHLTRDFKSATGRTPTAFTKQP